MDYTTFTPFGLPFYTTILSEDTSSLLNEPLKVSQLGDGNLKDIVKNFGDYMRVLERYPEIKKVILDHWYNFYHNYFQGKRAEFAITTSWLTETKKGDTIPEHDHKNAFYSGLLYYGDYENDSGTLEFVNPMADHFTPNLLPEDGLFGSLYQPWYIPPKHNLLIFFPACVKHRCYSINKYRLSCAFNIMSIPSLDQNDSYYDPRWLIND